MYLQLQLYWLFIQFHQNQLLKYINNVKYRYFFWQKQISIFLQLYRLTQSLLKKNQFDILENIPTSLSAYQYNKIHIKLERFDRIH